MNTKMPLNLLKYNRKLRISEISTTPLWLPRDDKLYYLGNVILASLSKTKLGCDVIF